ncbi:MAG TPA: NADH-quinone oxidoreductase subunit C [Bacteroidetes bacterium]|nr:NADH-quinone oxidoreductase subunit C [Bacteroidota bacterium]
MTKEELQEKALSIFPEAEISLETAKDYINITLPSEKLHEVAEKLKNDPETQFDFLFCLSGVDWPEYIEVVYHLRSTTLKHEIVLRGKMTDRENARIDTVCDLWKTAEFHEREVFDLFGVHFNNHPDLRRIFLEDDWVGHPMRKDYVDEVNIVEL